MVISSDPTGFRTDQILLLRNEHWRTAPGALSSTHRVPPDIPHSLVHPVDDVLDVSGPVNQSGLDDASGHPAIGGVNRAHPNRVLTSFPNVIVHNRCVDLHLDSIVDRPREDSLPGEGVGAPPDTRLVDLLFESALFQLHHDLEGQHLSQDLVIRIVGVDLGYHGCYSSVTVILPYFVISFSIMTRSLSSNAAASAA